MDDIAKELVMSKKTLYQYYKGKEDLVNKIVETHLIEEKELIRRNQGQSEDAIDEMIRIARYVIEFMSNLKPTMSYDLKKYYPKSWSMVEIEHMGFVKETITNNINRGKDEGVYREEIITEIIANLYVSNSMNIALIQMPKEDALPSEIYREMILYHLHGIMTEKGKQLFKKNKTRTYAKV